MFNDIIPMMYIEGQKWESTLLHALCTVGGGVANNLNDASNLPHLTEFYSYTILYKLWTHRGVITPLLHFYTVDPAGTVSSGEFSQIYSTYKL